MDPKVGDFIYYAHNNYEVIFCIIDIDHVHYKIKAENVDSTSPASPCGSMFTADLAAVLSWGDRAFKLPAIPNNSIKTCTCDMIKLMQKGCNCGGS